MIKSSLQLIAYITFYFQLFILFSQKIYNNTEKMYVGLFIIGILECLLIFIRKKIKNYYVVIGVHILLLSCFSYLIIYNSLFLKLNLNRVISSTCILQILISIIIMYGKKNDRIANPDKIKVGIMMVLYIMCEIWNLKSIQTVSFALSVIYLSIYCMFTSLVRSEKYISIRELNTKMDTKSMVCINRNITFVYTGIILCIMIIASKLSYAGLLQKIKEILYGIINVLFRNREYTNDEKDVINNGLDKIKFKEKFGSPNEFLRILGEIVWILAEVALAVFVIYVLYKLFMHIFKIREKNKDSKFDTKTFLNPFEKKDKITRKKINFSLKRNNRENVRRKYRKGMQSFLHKSNGNPDNMTVNMQICEKLKDKNLKVSKEELYVTKQIYEKARYSIEDISKEEVKKIIL